LTPLIEGEGASNDQTSIRRSCHSNACAAGYGHSRRCADALSVEWQGKKPCEKLHEDDQIRILRCTFPPGGKHVRHQHPANFVYVLSGGKLQEESTSGTRDLDVLTDAYVLSKPVPWHEVTNTGDTTERFIVVEMKYQK
jgi:beta-alanine degradation protein BauB